ncbi:hypothetical protein ACL00O_12770 [Aeromonas sanarellii]|uniref:GapS4a family protein n=1 Tax=Aeromonas sanarellii TaxID=633415 RepID=UPI0039A25EA6
MGEFSKRVGDVGEDIVVDILGLMGWKNVGRNIQLPCCTISHEKRTHGIDALYLYESPLESNTVENVIISSKYSSNPYDAVVSTFKKHFKDIANTIECYSKSSLKAEYNKTYKRSMRKNDTGVLFYFNNDDDPNNQEVISQISNSRIDKELKYKTIHVIDNKRASFLFDALTHMRNNYPERVEFYYPSTSLNISSPDKKYRSSIMPVEFITAPIIPIVISEPDNKQLSLCLLTNDGISDESLKLLIDCAREMSHDLTRNIILIFPHYNILNHKEMIERAKLSLSADEKQLNIEVKSFNTSYSG